jgi:Cft2 family RNA processing exonuclease
MSVTYLAGGGASVIGNSFSLLNFDGKYRLGMDWGGGYDSIYNEPRYSGPLDCLFISHAHLDHCAQVPRVLPRWQKQNPNFKLFATDATADLCRLVWNQALFLAKENDTEPPFSEEDICRTLDSIERVEYNKEIKLNNDTFVVPVSAGHIIGSISPLVIHKKEIYYLTSDICFRDRSFTKGAEIVRPVRSRFLGRESTYINQVFEPREDVVARFTETSKSILNNGGRIIVPALSIDRTQDLYAIAKKAGLPVYIDGSRKATEVYANHLGQEGQMLLKAERFENQEARLQFLKSRKPAMIIASSGMLHRSTMSAFWVQQFAPNPKDAAFVVNYQDPGGQGSSLLQTKQGYFFIFNGMIVRRACRLEKFNFSAHMDGKDGQELEERLNPDVVVYNHGSRREVDRYIKAHESDGRRRVRARVGQEIEV